MNVLIADPDRDFLKSYKTLLELSGDKQDIEREVDAEEEHKDGADVLDIGGKTRDAVVLRPEPPRPGGAEGGADRIEERHPPAEQEDHVQGGHGDINQV